MSPADLPQSLLFLMFLALFVLLGIYPAWQKTARLIRKAIATSKQPPATAADFPVIVPTEGTAEQQPVLQLDTLESLVFLRLVLHNGKSLSRKQINATLHLEPALLKTTLEALLHRGLLKITMTALPIIRFQLTERGRAYGLQTGVILPDY